jgi:hypothetical protein
MKSPCCDEKAQRQMASLTSKLKQEVWQCCKCDKLFIVIVRGENE